MVYNPFITPNVSTTKFRIPYPDNESQIVNYTQKISRSSRPGSKSKQYISKKAMKNYRTSLLKKSPTRPPPLPRKTIKTSGGIKPPQLVRLKTPTLKRLQQNKTSSVFGKKSRKRNTKKRKLTKKKNKKRQQS